MGKEKIDRILIARESKARARGRNQIINRFLDFRFGHENNRVFGFFWDPFRFPFLFKLKSPQDMNE